MEDKSFNRGYTHILTGATRLFDIPAQELFNYTIKHRLPAAFLPSFLHEASHFMCMSSDVGNSIALREIRAQRELIREDPDIEKIRTDLAIAMTAKALYAPLLEGMALFQEFDAFPGESDVFSGPSFWSGPLFAHPDEELGDTPAVDWVTGQIKQHLYSYRLSKSARDRKMRVLMSPIEDDQHAYLSGYLTVKLLWINSIHQTKALFDKELFIDFATFWFFQDWESIAHICDEDLDYSLIASRLSERFQERIHELANEDLTHEVAIYNREVGSGRRDPDELVKASRTSADQIMTGNSAYRAWIQELIDDIKDPEVGGAAQNDLMTFQHRRGMFRLAFEEVRVEVNEHRRGLVLKKDVEERFSAIILSVPAPVDCPTGSGSGKFATYYFPVDRTIMQVAIMGAEIALCLPNDESDDTKERRVCIHKMLHTEDARSQIGDIAFRLAREDLEFVVFEAAICEHVKELFGSFALSCVPDEHDRKVVRSKLSRKGLYDLFGGDGDLLTAYVYLSLLPRLTDTSWELITKQLAEDGIDLDESLEKLSAIQQTYGLPLMMQVDGKHLCGW